MDTPQRKVGYGRGAGRLVCDPVVSAPGPLVSSPGPLAASPDPVFDDANRINAVAVKLPELWQSKVRSWFVQAEAKFATSGISTSLTKY